MKKHYATHVEDTDKLISVAGTSPSLEFSNLLASEEWSSNEEEYDI